MWGGGDWEGRRDNGVGKGRRGKRDGRREGRGVWFMGCKNVSWEEY